VSEKDFYPQCEVAGFCVRAVIAVEATTLVQISTI
jgi:hypothetical protein